MTHWCRFLSSRGVCWTIENQSNSLLRAYPGLRDMVASAHVVHLHACMFGSQRKCVRKLPRLQETARGFGRLPCSARETTPTRLGERPEVREVRVYTAELSHAWASCAAAALAPELRQAPKSKKRGRKEVCEPDFDNIITVHAEEAAPFEHMFPPCRVPRKFTRWPEGSRLLFFDETDFSATLAVPSPPDVWCRRSMSLKHPRSLFQPLERAFEAELMVDSCGKVKARTAARKEIRTLCGDCAEEDLVLRKGLHRDVASVTKSKVSVAMKRLLVTTLCIWVTLIRPWRMLLEKAFPWSGGFRARVSGRRIAIPRVFQWSPCLKQVQRSPRKV